jgi:hypothetical protein
MAFKQRWLGISLLAWAMVWAFWLTLTRSSHPLFSLALIVTTSLIIAYAAASYINHLVLIPRFWTKRNRLQYFAWLIAIMAVLTGLALFVIRIAYTTSLGPDTDPYGVYKHYAIDLIGMVVHILAAAGVVKVLRRFTKEPKLLK